MNIMRFISANSVYVRMGLVAATWVVGLLCIPALAQAEEACFCLNVGELGGPCKGNDMYQPDIDNQDRCILRCAAMGGGLVHTGPDTLKDKAQWIENDPDVLHYEGIFARVKEGDRCPPALS